MADSSGSLLPLTLGFVGDQVVHRDNAFALIDDLIQAHRRTNRNAKVRFVIGVDVFTDTLDELADYCLNSKYTLDLVGHEKGLQGRRVKKYLEFAESVTNVPEEVATPVAVVKRISQWTYARLILIADPSEDDYTYLALEVATGNNIPVRSLLHGMHAVFLQTEEEEQPEQMPKNVEPDDDEEFEDEDEEEGDYEDEIDDEEGDEVEPDDDELEDEDEDEEEGTAEDEEEGDDEPEDEDEPDDDEEEDLEDEGDEPDEDDVEEEEEEEEVPTPPRARKAAAAPAAAAPVRYTRQKLERLAAAPDRQPFYDVVASFGITRGKGIKAINMINSILEAQTAGKKPRALPKGENAPTAPAKVAAKPVAVAKKTAAPKPAPVPARRPAAKPAAPAAKAPAATPENPVADTLRALGSAFLAAADQL